MRAQPNAKVAHLDIRVTAEQCRLLRRAARIQRMTVNQFVVQQACGRAADLLAGEPQIMVKHEAWQALMAALDAPPRVLPRLQALMNEAR